MANKKFIEDVLQMEMQILICLDTLFDEESDYYIDLKEENLTEFFTALSNAIGHKLTKTGMAKNLLEAQHVYNSLLLQYLLESGAKVEGGEQ